MTPGGPGHTRPGPATVALSEVARLQEDLQAWAGLIRSGETEGADGGPVRVLVDQAEDLRRRLRDVGDTCRLPLGQIGHGYVSGRPPSGQASAPSPAVAALGAAAASLHAAAHAIGPAASALCDQDHLPVTLSTSAQVARRFLTAASEALHDALGPDSHHLHGGLDAVPELNAPPDLRGCSVHQPDRAWTRSACCRADLARRGVAARAP